MLGNLLKLYVKENERIIKLLGNLLMLASTFQGVKLCCGKDYEINFYFYSCIYNCFCP